MVADVAAADATVADVVAVEIPLCGAWC